VERFAIGIWGVGGFVFYRRDYCDGRVEAVLVVPAIDPQGDFLAGLGFGGSGPLSRAKISCSGLGWV